LVNTWLQDLTSFHALRLSEALGASSRVASDMLAGLARQMRALTPNPDRALLLAQDVMGHVVGREALTLAFNDVFRIMAWLFVAALVLVPFCRPPKQVSSAPVEAH
jgi:DHA2 family multidrug resistance protein